MTQDLNLVLVPTKYLRLFSDSVSPATEKCIYLHLCLLLEALLLVGDNR
jgi:hypothetical protein